MNEQIFRLDVSVDHVFAVTVLDGLEQLVYVLTDQYFIDAVGVLFQHLEQVLLQILKH